MKNILIFISIAFASLMFSSQTFAITCDQDFENRMVRYDYNYQFTDAWHNHSNQDVYLNTRKITWKNSDFVDAGIFFDNGRGIDWTQELRDADFTVPPNSSDEDGFPVLSTRKTDWKIVKTPDARTPGTIESHDFMLAYTIGYDFSNNYPNASDDIQHTECAYYSVTWCGDGVVDSAYDEECDGSAGLTGNQTCSSTCQIIEAQPVCNGIDTSVQVGEIPLSVEITCSGANVDKYTLDCGDGTQIFTENTTASTFIKTCNYNNSGTYTPSCTVNDTVTNATCQDTINVSAPVPSISIEKTDWNQDDLDRDDSNDKQTVISGERAVFKIRVTNDGKEDLKNLSLDDPRAANCSSDLSDFPNQPDSFLTMQFGGNGDHTNNILEQGEWFEYTCEKSNATEYYKNVVSVEGFGVFTETPVPATDDTEVFVVDYNPSISIEKKDVNPNDLDGLVGGNDSQEVYIGDEAVFNIEVTNTGDENLVEVFLSDPNAPICSRTIQETLPMIQAVGNNDDIFDIGETFNYDCTVPNTQADYTNTARVDAKGELTRDPVHATDPTTVVVREKIYDLALSKKPVQTNPAHIYNKGDTVEFVIRVSNQGNQDASNIEVTDYIPEGLTYTGTGWTQSGNLLTRTIDSIPAKGYSDLLSVQFEVTTNVAGPIINWAEISADDGNDVDSTPDQDNNNDCHGDVGRDEVDSAQDDNLDGKGDANDNQACEAGEDEDDHDPALINVGSITPEVNILKYSANLNDTDGNIVDSNENDTQTILEGTTEVFRIIVSNPAGAPEGLTDIVITDEKAPVCSRTAEQTLVLIQNQGNGDNILDPGEGFPYTCEQTNTLGEYTNIATVTAKGVVSGESDDDFDNTEVKIEAIFDLALTKVVQNLQQTYAVGDTVTYTISVENQGTVDATNVVITDSLPAGLSLTDDTWTTDNEGQATKTIPSIVAGATEELTIRFEITDEAVTENTVSDGTVSITNLAEITSADGGDDIDSTPDDNLDDDCIGEDNATGGNGEGTTGDTCNSGTDEDDHDPAVIVVEVPNVTCESLSMASTSGTATHSTAFTCTGAEATVFNVDCGNGEAFDVATGTCTYSSPGTYTAICTADGSTSNSCEQTVIVTQGDTYTPSGGGGSPTCKDLEIAPAYKNVAAGDSVPFRCDVKGTKDIRVNCGEDPSDFTEGTGGKLEGSCTYAYEGNYTITCDYKNTTASSWVTNNFRCQENVVVGAGSCGDGVVQEQSSRKEQCDPGHTNGTEICTTDCKLKSTGTILTIPCENRDCTAYTIPNEGALLFGADTKIVVGDGGHVFKETRPYIENDTREDYYLGHLCIVQERVPGIDAINFDGDSDDTEKCVPFGDLYKASYTDDGEVIDDDPYEISDVLYPGTKLYFPENTGVTGDTSKFGNQDDFVQNTLYTTIKIDQDGNGIRTWENTFMKATTEVTVAKPAIQTSGGGTSVVNRTANTQAVVDNFLDSPSNDTNSNFVGTSAGDAGSSLVTDDVDTNAEGEIEKIANELDNDTTNDSSSSIDLGAPSPTASAVTTIESTTSSDVSKFSSYRGQEDVFFLVGESFKVNASNVSNLSDDVKTYVIENGNLEITKDIDGKNIAFVVRNGNIIIADDVKEIKATLIVIPGTTTDTGKIISENSSEQLTVDGSLYGDTSELVSNRTYIDYDEGSETLGVGTLVGFGSSLFRDTPPLLSTFVDEYLSTTRTAR